MLNKNWDAGRFGTKNDVGLAFDLDSCARSSRSSLRLIAQQAQVRVEVVTRYVTTSLAGKLRCVTHQASPDRSNTRRGKSHLRQDRGWTLQPRLTAAHDP